LENGLAQVSINPRMTNYPRKELCVQGHLRSTSLNLGKSVTVSPKRYIVIVTLED